MLPLLLLMDELEWFSTHSGKLEHIEEEDDVVSVRRQNPKTEVKQEYMMVMHEEDEMLVKPRKIAIILEYR